MERILKQYLPGGKFIGVSKRHSKNMAAVRGHGNKTTEQRLRYALVRSGIKGWHVRPKGLRGNPDFLFSKLKVVVFVDGCFWHGCPNCGHVPNKNRPYWSAKLERNMERDVKTTAHLKKEKFKVLRFWEHELKRNLPKCLAKIEATLKARRNKRTKI